ncbi:Protein kinase of the Mitotic Exit Network, partial [Coemansia biformis]
MSAKLTPSVGLGDFRPEELFGQLKAEQLSRNYDMAVRFIDAVLGLQLEACTLRESLRDGVVLCRLINALRPGAVKRINTKGLPFTQMENISNFLAAAQSLGLESSDLFQTVDLYEGKNMPRVVMTLLTIARVVAGIPLNSHRKLVDVQRTLGDGWGSTTLAASDAPPLRALGTDDATVRIDPTLVGAIELDAAAASAPVGAREESKLQPLSPTSTSLYGRSLGSSTRRERRRSKRQSAVTLFAASGMGVQPALLAAANGGGGRATRGRPGGPEQQPAQPRQPGPAHAQRGAHADGPDARPSSARPSSPESAAAPVSAPRPKKRTGTKSRPRERLTVYSESAQRLTNYQLGNCIGRGQFGSVYRALDLETGQMVAVKQISLEGQDTDNMEDVMQEVELLKSLSSPRIVRYYGFVKSDTHLNLVMEFVENGSLSATLKSFGAFPEKLVLAYAVKIIEGLICLHRNDVVHCDLKACNILTTKNGNTKLTDFGVSLNLKLRKPGDESAVAGTPYWMAPEIIQLEGACTASDIWSLGCTVIELLTGKPPYADLMQMAALYRIVEDDHPPIPEGISEELRDFLLRCFQKSPSSRPTAQALMAHPWTAQYRSNRKEMKLLRRTCSRKMSSFIAHKKPACEYPTFNPAQLKPLAPPADEVASSDAESWEEETRNPKPRPKPEPKSESELELEPEAKHEPEPGPGPKFETKQGHVPGPKHGYEIRSEPLAAAVAAVLPAPTPGPPVSTASGDDTDTSISTFEGPRLKRHRLRTILCDANSVCVVCSKTLSGAFIQCTSCKTRCHDACVQLLQPCTAMRMSRFLYPASRKSSKRYESKSPNIRLRTGRRSALRRQHSRTASATHAGQLEMSAAELFSSVYSSHASGLLGSSDGSLHLASLRGAAADLRQATVHDGFDGVIDAGGPLGR